MEGDIGPSLLIYNNESKGNTMRELQPSVALHAVNRSIARPKAEVLNTLAYAFDQASPLRDEMQLPQNSKLTVNTVVVPSKQISITDSAIYRELYE